MATKKKKKRAGRPRTKAKKRKVTRAKAKKKPIKRAKAKKRSPAKKRAKAKKTAKRRKKRKSRVMTLAQARRVVQAILKNSRSVREGSNLTLDQSQIEEMVRNIEHVCGGSKMRGVNYLMAKFDLKRKAAEWYVAEYCAATQSAYFDEDEAEPSEYASAIKAKIHSRPKRWYDITL